MTGRILLLGLLLGVAGIAGAREVNAFPVIEPTRLLDPTMPDAGFLPAGSKRHGIHHGFGGGHKGFHGRRLHKGFHGSRFTKGFHGKSFHMGFPGHRVHKEFHGHRLFAGRHLPHGGTFFSQRSFGSGFSFGLRFHHGDVFLKQRFASPGFSFGHPFGHRGVIVRQRFAGPGVFFDHPFGHRNLGVFLGERFGHRPMFFGRQFHDRFARWADCDRDDHPHGVEELIGSERTSILD
ncbi:MAG TPA: hypothetical protein VLE23_14920 [Geminicoccaceae bacterium]|nr:hypothetical protein [Geminicoccaceae bacterium]